MSGAFLFYSLIYSGKDTWWLVLVKEEILERVISKKSQKTLIYSFTINLLYSLFKAILSVFWFIIIINIDYCLQIYANLRIDSANIQVSADSQSKHRNIRRVYNKTLANHWKVYPVLLNRGRKGNIHSTDEKIYRNPVDQT